jgi:small subunit ribosomal protein S8
MSMNDMISDVLTRIRNGQMAAHSVVKAPYSSMVVSVLEVLKSEGYIMGYEQFEERAGIKGLNIQLKYNNGKPVIDKIKRISKPGRRVYAKAKSLPKPFNGLGVAIISTPKGVMCDESARRENLGGEIVCEVY